MTNTPNDSIHTLTPETIATHLAWKAIGADTDSGGNTLAGTMLAPAILDNGFGLILRTNPEMKARFGTDVYTAFVAGNNVSGRAEVLAGYTPYEYITAEAVLYILAELSDLAALDPEEEAAIFISHPSNLSSARPAWYDLAGWISFYLAGVATGINIFLDKLSGGGNDDDDDQW
tara:strand:+ start:2611 stop:3132 length:522 start_codon:yes stop_codon:yes gene_type:complete